MTITNILKFTRLTHHYIGVFFAPTVLFFAITGAFRCLGCTRRAAEVRMFLLPFLFTFRNCIRKELYTSRQVRLARPQPPNLLRLRQTQPRPTYRRLLRLRQHRRHPILFPSRYFSLQQRWHLLHRLAQVSTWPGNMRGEKLWSSGCCLQELFAPRFCCFSEDGDAVL